MEKVKENHKEYTLHEELWHAITHSLGLGLSIAGLIVLLVYTSVHGSALEVVSSAIFGFTLILLYASSTLYHASQNEKNKKIFKQLDHASIYALIAGTYTPITLLTLDGVWGWSIFATVWSAAVIGIVIKILYPGRFEKFSLFLYLLMGWMIIVAMNPMFENMQSGGLWLLLAGGLSYTFGVIFYVLDRLPYNHAIWHIFVLAGSIFHYLMVFLYVI